MSNSSRAKRRFSVTIDANLANQVDKLTDNRSQAIEEGLRLWYVKQIEDQLRHFYEYRSQADTDFEEAWVQDTQDEAIAVWDEVPWNLLAKDD